MRRERREALGPWWWLSPKVAFSFSSIVAIVVGERIFLNSVSGAPRASLRDFTTDCLLQRPHLK